MENSPAGPDFLSLMGLNRYYEKDGYLFPLNVAASSN